MNEGLDAAGAGIVTRSPSRGRDQRLWVGPAVLVGIAVLIGRGVHF